MAWLCVDKDGTESIFDNLPVRRCNVKNIFCDISTLKIIRRAYTKNQYNKWSAAWSSDINDHLPLFRIELPKGSIKKLIGRELKWEDEPVEI